MDSAIHVGASGSAVKALAKTINKSAEAICAVLYAAHESHADQETVRAALRALARFTPAVNGVSLSGCHVEAFDK